VEQSPSRLNSAGCSFTNDSLARGFKLELEYARVLVGARSPPRPPPPPALPLLLPLPSPSSSLLLLLVLLLLLLFLLYCRVQSSEAFKHFTLHCPLLHALSDSAFIGMLPACQRWRVAAAPHAYMLCH